MKRSRPSVRPVAAGIAVLIVIVGGLTLWMAVRDRPPEAVSAVAEIAPVAGPVGQVAARVAGEPIYVYDITREAAAQSMIAPRDVLRPGDEVYERILQELIDQKLLAQEAAARGLDETPEASRRLETARERILGNVLLENEVSNSVTDEAIRRMYDEQVRLVEMGDEVHARHILVATREEAEELRRQIAEEDADFSQLAFEHSLDEATRLEGGDLGYFTADTLTGPLATAAYATPVGEVSAPVESSFGWHLVMVEDRRASERPSFENLRPRIVRFMTFDAIQQLLAGLRESAEIQLLTPEIEEPSPGADDGADPMTEFLNPGPANPAAGIEEGAGEAAAALRGDNAGASPQ